MYNDELYHYGVKGMKWGVRRYQNYDGTLTPKGQKRLASLEKKRDNLANKAKDNASRNKQYAKDSKRELEDLKKNGKRSKTFKDYLNDQEESYRETRDKAYENARETSKTDLWKGLEDHTKAYTEYSDNIRKLDSVSGRNEMYKELLSTTISDIDDYNKAAKSWTKTNKDLLNMPITVATKKSELYRKYYFGYF